MKRFISFLLVFVFCAIFAQAQTSSVSAIGYGPAPDSPEATINNVSGPDTLLVGQQGIWIVTATSSVADERMLFQLIVNGVIVDTSVTVSQSAHQLFAAYFYHTFNSSGSKSLLFRLVSQVGTSERSRSVFVISLNTNPVITHFSGNYGLLQYHPGHWTAKFLDNEQGTLRASVFFGDGDTLVITKHGLPGQEFTIYFDHNYKSAGIFTIRLKVDDLVGGIATVTWQVVVFPSVTDVANEPVPTEFSLSQNYPNPFNPTTTIRFNLPNSEQVLLIVYDLLGREVATLVNEQRNAGYHSVQFNAAGDLPSGIYLYRIQAGKFVQTKKMILMK